MLFHACRYRFEIEVCSIIVKSPVSACKLGLTGEVLIEKRSILRVIHIIALFDIASCNVKCSFSDSS